MNNPLGVSPSKGLDSHRGQKIFSLPRVVPCFPLLGLTPSGLFMGLSSTIIYTSELILWFPYLCSQCYAAQHSYVPLLRLTNPWPSNSRSNWNLEMLIFEEGGKLENPEKNPRSREENQQQTQPTYDAGSENRTRDTLVGGERSHLCATPAPQLKLC